MMIGESEVRMRDERRREWLNDRRYENEAERRAHLRAANGTMMAPGMRASL